MTKFPNIWPNLTIIPSFVIGWILSNIMCLKSNRVTQKDEARHSKRGRGFVLLITQWWNTDVSPEHWPSCSCPCPWAFAALWSHRHTHTHTHTHTHNWFTLPHTHSCLYPHTSTLSHKCYPCSWSEIEGPEFPLCPWAAHVILYPHPQSM